MIKPEFLKAREAAELILSKVKYDKDQNELISTVDLIRAVEEELQIDIQFTTFDFRKFVGTKDKATYNMESYGAAMHVSEKDGKKRAVILLNDKENTGMQRFSLVHELGHLMTQGASCDGGYRISTHIDMNITSIPKELLEDQKYQFLIAEQQANIFALLVLMPKDMFERVKREKDSLSEMAKIFGVEKDAIYSRIMLEVTERG